MTTLKQMYQILGNMLEKAEERDKEKVLRLNKSFEELALEVFQWPTRTKSDLDYDNCRQACVGAVTALQDMYEAYISDAKDRFSKIPAPEH